MAADEAAARPASVLAATASNPANQLVATAMIILPMAEPHHAFAIAQKPILLLVYPHQHQQIIKEPIRKGCCSLVDQLPCRRHH
jgi:hypothetical protein